MKVTVLLGPPAAGKGTLASRLVKEYGYTLVSTGDILRAHIAANGPRSNGIRQAIESGGLISADDFRAVFLAHMAQLPRNADILMDGAPRNAPGMDLFLEGLDKGDYELGAIILLSADPDTLRARMTKRAFADAARGKARKDDKADIFETRLKTFETETKPIIARLQREFSDTLRVDNARLTPDETFATVKAYLDAKPCPQRLIAAPPAAKPAAPASP